MTSTEAQMENKVTKHLSCFGKFVSFQLTYCSPIFLVPLAASEGGAPSASSPFPTSCELLPCSCKLQNTSCGLPAACAGGLLWWVYVHLNCLWKVHVVINYVLKYNANSGVILQLLEASRARSHTNIPHESYKVDETRRLHSCLHWTKCKF